MGNNNEPTDKDIKKMEEEVEGSFFDDEHSNNKILQDGEATQYQRDYQTIANTARAFNNFGHYDESMIQGMIYMSVSRLLGPQVNIDREQLSWLLGSDSKISPNIYMLLVGPPGYFSKSSLIRNQKDWCEQIQRRYTEKYSGTVLDSFEMKTSIVGSSMEGVTDDLAGLDDIIVPNTEGDAFEIDDEEDEEEPKRKPARTKKQYAHKYIYIDAGECGQALKRLVNPNNYQYGLLDILNDVFYGDRVSRTLKKGKVEVPQGQYVTFLGSIHNDELVSELLETGFLRRTVTITKTEADYKYQESTLEQKKIWSTYYEMTKNEFIEHMADRVNIVKGASVRLIPSAEEYLNNMDNKIRKYREETRDSNEYPSHNLELIIRLSILHAIYEGYTEGNGSTIYVTTDEIVEAEDYLKGLDKRYRLQTSKLISSDIIRRIDMLTSVVNQVYEQQKKKGTTGFGVFATRSTLYHRFPYLDSAKIKDLEYRAIEMGKIKGAEVYRDGRKPKNILYPSNVDDDELERLKLENDKIVYRQ